MESTLLCFRYIMPSFGDYRANVWLYLCVAVSFATVPYLVDTQEWGLHILINNIDMDLKYLHTGIMGD